MNEHERWHLLLTAKYNAVQKNPDWSEQDLNVLNAAIAEAHALSLSSLTGPTDFDAEIAACVDGAFDQ